MITDTRRANLTKLADYLESLPADYSHFDMSTYQDHRGECTLMPDLDIEAIETEGYDAPARAIETLYAQDIGAFLSNCGTIACALGHGPAAGIPIDDFVSTHRIAGREIVTDISFHSYSLLFVPDTNYYGMSNEWNFLFGGDWETIDNHHYGAAARIRYYLDKDETLGVSSESVDAYAGYRKAE